VINVNIKTRQEQHIFSQLHFTEDDPSPNLLCLENKELKQKLSKTKIFLI